MSPPKKEPQSPDSASGERLQKVLAAAGVGSRRDCEELIAEGRVEVDGQVVTVLGTKVNPDIQTIRVDGEPIREHRRVYYVLNKPVGVVTTNSDPSGRARVIDFIPDKERVFPVGRLDRASEGLIIVTNDGELAFRLTHPKFGVEKEYLVRIAGKLEESELQRLRRGIHLSDGLARVVSLRILGSHKQSTDLEIVLREGKNREIRRILARVGHKVLSLKRVAVGPIRLGDMPPGASRKLSNDEVKQLLTQRSTTGSKGKEKRRPPKKDQPTKLSSPASSQPAAKEPIAADKKRTKPPEKPARPSKRPEKRPQQIAQFDLDDEDELLDLNELLPSDDYTPPRRSKGKAPRSGSILDYGEEPTSTEGMPPERIRPVRTGSKGKRPPATGSRGSGGRSRAAGGSKTVGGSKPGQRFSQHRRTREEGTGTTQGDRGSGGPGTRRSPGGGSRSSRPGGASAASPGKRSSGGRPAGKRSGSGGPSTGKRPGGSRPGSGPGPGNRGARRKGRR